MLFGLLKGMVKSAVIMAALGAAGLGYGYYKLASAKLEAPPDAAVSAGVCRTTPSISGGTLPATFEAFVKDAKGHNWLDSGGSLGLVTRRLEWSHARFEWVEDRLFAERQAEAAKMRAALAERGPDELIKDLRSDDAIRREVSAKQLRIMTGQSLGYAYDGTQAQREQAAAAWEKWWADPKNKAIYKATEITKAGQGWIEKGQKALEILRRATEEAPSGQGR